MREVTMELRRLIEAYRWQRGLGHDIIATPYGRIVTNLAHPTVWDANHADAVTARSEEHTSELQSLMRISYAVFCLKKKNTNIKTHKTYPIKKQQLNKKL